MGIAVVSPLMDWSERPHTSDPGRQRQVFPLIGDVIWLIYCPGQALLVASIAGALQVAGATLG
jgi:hypothetical protein